MRFRGPARLSLLIVAGVGLAATLPLASPTHAAGAAARIDENRLTPLLEPNPDVDRIRALGPGVLPPLASIYERSDETRRTSLAYVFYALGWKSEDAKRVLMRDVHTPNASLRLQVQWALGRVSNDPDVVQVLLDNMRHDDNPLFRDKAACALAHDQIHLTDDQKLRLYQGLVEALGDGELQVRQIAIQVLNIQTGQTKNFDPAAPVEARQRAIEEWRRWLETYREHL